MWHEWDEWQACNVTCGDGHQMRSRDRTWELYDGAACVGDQEERQPCNPRPCPSKSNAYVKIIAMETMDYVDTWDVNCRFSNLQYEHVDRVPEN